MEMPERGIAKGEADACTTSVPVDCPVWVCLFGSFRLIRSGEPVAVRGGGKTEALLARLGLAGTNGVARDVLLRGLWPDSDRALANQALASLVHSLRSLLGEALGDTTPVIQSGGHYRLNTLSGIGVDVTRFGERVNRAEAFDRAGEFDAAVAEYQRAIGLYAGDLTPAAGASPRTALERERLRATCCRVLIRLADISFLRGNFAASLQHAMQLLERDACREDAHRMVMRCHVRLGARSQALRQYHTARAILRTELDADPEPATLALFEAIRLKPDSV
jgi:DNA-binding SARP family transcriptional activator